MERGHVIRTQRRQWVSLPASAALQEGVTEVEVLVIGRPRVMVAAGERWDSWFDEEPASEEFIGERDQLSTASAFTRLADFDEG